MIIRFHHLVTVQKDNLVELNLVENQNTTIKVNPSVVPIENLKYTALDEQKHGFVTFAEIHL